jgi:hypothetical protein
MAWDIEITINAPAQRVFDVAAAWHRFPELRSLAAVTRYEIAHQDPRSEYFWLGVRDLPLLTSWCYGRRLFKRPQLLVTIFTYRFFRNRLLEKPEELERIMHRDWERFFYQTTRFEELDERQTRLRAMEPGRSTPAPEQRRSLELYYERLRFIAEGELAPVAANILVDDEFAVESGVQAAGIEAGAPNLAPFEGGAAPGAGKTPILDDYDPYHILGLSREAGLQEIKQAFRALALRWHPDRMGGPPAMKEYAHNQFIEVTAAYHTILRERER